jgi:hypothetical protein
VNAGGLIYLEEEILGHPDEQAAIRVRGIGDTISQLLDQAKQQGLATSEAADRLTRQRLRGAS